MGAKKKIHPEDAGYVARQIACPRCGEITRATANLCGKCSYVFSAADKRRLVSGGVRSGITRNGRVRKIEVSIFVREMAERGFKYIRHVDGITGKLVRNEDDPQIEKLDLQFEAIPRTADGIHVTQTSPQIQVSMSLDKFLELTGIKP